MTVLLILIAAALLLGWQLLRLGNQGRAASGLPAGEVIFSDVGAWQRPTQSFISRRYELVGKPDYLVATPASQAPIPIEVKTGRRPAQPHQGHIMQLAAYCLLIEETWHSAPPNGLLHYTGGADADAVTLRIQYTPALRSRLLDLLDQMRAARDADEVGRSHDEPARCRSCGVAHACTEKL